MFEELMKNLEQEKKIIVDLRSIHSSLKLNPNDSQFYMSSANSLLHQLRILNQAVPELLKEWSPITAKSEKDKTNNNILEKNTVTMAYVSPVTKEKKFVTINKEDKKEFLSKLKISEQGLMTIQKLKVASEVKEEGVNKPSAYARISNKFFRDYSEKYSNNFSSLQEDLKKSNIRFLLQTYISMMFFSVVLSALLGIIIYTLLLIISTSNWIYFWGVLLFPCLIAAGFYLYPASEASSVQKSITQELPFATIHMAAIAGSDISPLKIFKIISVSKEYPHVGREIKKIISQVEFYGNDLVTALKNVATNTSNKSLSELFSGLATNISTGGALKVYLQKKSENFLLDYRLERQKYTDLAGTFMDVYISVLIAAPLVLMMMFIVMNVSGLGIGGLSINALMFISILGIVIINIIFVIIVNLKQPAV